MNLRFDGIQTNSTQSQLWSLNLWTSIFSKNFKVCWSNIESIVWNLDPSTVYAEVNVNRFWSTPAKNCRKKCKLFCSRFFTDIYLYSVIWNSQANNFPCTSRRKLKLKCLQWRPMQRDIVYCFLVEMLLWWISSTIVLNGIKLSLKICKMISSTSS